MRLSMIRACAVAAVTAIALTACAGRGIVPSSSSAFAPGSADLVSPLASSCATSPPQYNWIFKGSCTKFTLKSTGGSFSLAAYEDVTVKGSIGKNTAKGSVTVYIADAIDKNGDIETNGGKKFPTYKAEGTTVVYAAVNNQSSQIIKPITEKNKTVLQYTITDSKGLPGSSCGAALLEEAKDGKFSWHGFPGTFPVKGKTVTISVYEAPSGFELPPKGTPLYFGVNCYKG
jgi:hypothetical protein